jgi:hypothetical protein
MKKTTLAISNTIALVATIAINYFSNTGMMNGNTMSTISDRYSNFFTPSGYAFSIWGLIYLGLLGFIFYSWRIVKEGNYLLLSKIGWWFVISCIANSFWVVAWLYDSLGISVLLMILLFISLFKIIENADVIGWKSQSLKTLIFVKWPFSIYFGWVSVALIANLAAFLTKIGWDGWGISGVVWTVMMLCIAGLVNIAVIQIKKLYPFGLVGIWAVLAIAVANKSESNSDVIIYTCYAIAAVLGIFILISLVNKKPIKNYS